VGVAQQLWLLQAIKDRTGRTHVLTTPVTRSVICTAVFSANMLHHLMATEASQQ